MREATASPDREPEKRPGNLRLQVVPVDTGADVMSQFHAELREADDADVVLNEDAEPPRIAVFPTGSQSAPPEVAQPDGASVATAPPKPRNWRNAILSLLALVILTQGALMAYWMIASGGLAAVTRTTGNVTITSEPTGSTVAIDGTLRGQTPLTIAIESGAHTIVVGTGAQSRSQSVSVARGGDSSMHVQLPAAVAAPALAKGALQIATEPPGARVWVDGEAHGTAPITISDLSGGDHAVTVRSASGDSVSRTVTVREGTTASLVISMPSAGASASGWLAISSPVPLQVMEKGALLGTTEMPRIMLPTGAHELELVNAGLNYRVTRKVTIAGGQTAAFTVTPPRGTLSVNALPWAEVWIDGQRAGETPIGNYSIPIGTHELLFRHPEFGEQRRTVIIGTQGPARVGVDMKKP